ncbi:MAG TPA: glycine betaine ABC transporter substrate-binding protein [Myxococcaceae bacterium]|nr:glycine betaine ABC transporter substrate-binding protein [Myxococcaceae bacterium]
MKVLLLLALSAVADPRPVRVGSKAFTESVIVGELATGVLQRHGLRAEHVRGLGGTRVVWDALVRGEVDVYPEYTGTLAEEIFGGRVRADALGPALAAAGIELGPALGFEDGYALGMREDRAERLGIRRISDLRTRPELRLGFSSEFIDRADGWRALQRAYGLPQRDVRGLEHELAYRGLRAGALDVVDLYSTDPEIQAEQLRVLEDDRRHFPEYRAVLLVRADLERRVPGARAALVVLQDRIDAPAMIAMNARARLQRVPEPEVAAAFLRDRLGEADPEVAPTAAPGRTRRILARLGEHLTLVAVSLGLSLAVAVPLGVFAARRRRAGQAVLATVGVVQTIPSLALLVLMIPLLGIGTRPAIAALFLYGLLPIVRNTHAGLAGIAPDLRESADALGLPGMFRLLRVELPLASPSILAGVKTSAVIAVGTATLGALVGAGGFGQPILTGIRLADTGLLLEGALPAAALALAVEAAFDGVERLVVPLGLRLRPEEPG